MKTHTPRKAMPRMTALPNWNMNSGKLRASTAIGAQKRGWPVKKLLALLGFLWILGRFAPAQTTTIIGGNKMFTGNGVHEGTETFAGPASFGGGSTRETSTLTENVNGEFNVQSFGARCDGVTDDTAAFLAASTAAFGSAPGSALLIPATGHSCLISQWNLTNNFGFQTGSKASVVIRGQSGILGQQSTIQCIEPRANTGNCLDLSGSDFVTIENLNIWGGTRGSNAPKTVIFMARDNADRGFTNGFYFRNVTISFYGQFGLYTYGGEIGMCQNCRISYAGPVSSYGEADVLISNVNTRGLTSSFQTLKTGVVSMTKWSFDQGTQLGGFNLGGALVELDNGIGSFPISDVVISGYAQMGSDTARPFIKDLLTGEVHTLRLSFLRVESNNAGNQLVTLGSASVKGFTVEATTFVDATTPTVPEIVFSNAAGSVGEGSVINLQPGDTQVEYPGGRSPSTVISCAGAVYGLVIYDRNQYNGGNMPNACSGAIEIPGGSVRTNWWVDGIGRSFFPGGAQGSSMSAIDPNFGSTHTETYKYCETAGGPTTLSTSGTTTNTGRSCLPETAVIDAVVYRITTTIKTAASFTIGDATTAARFCATQSTLTAGTTGICFAQADQTGAGGPKQASAASVRVTTNANPGAGAIRLIVYYHTWTPPAR